MPDDTIATRPRNPDTDTSEDRFRYRVRDVLRLSWDTRDEAIFSELHRLKGIEARVKALAGISAP
jgi:hypothetical protein